MRVVVFIVGTTIVFIEWGMMRIIININNNKTNTSSPRPLRVIVTAWTISWTVLPKKARTGNRIRSNPSVERGRRRS